MTSSTHKVIVITGASSGIGEATAKRLAARGDKIVLAARREDRLKNLVADINAQGGQAIYQVTDVTKRAEVEALAQRALAEFGQIDVWLNNAGLMPQSLFDKLKVDEWDTMIDVNIKGTLYGIAAALLPMRARQSGHFINLSSVAGHCAHPGSGVYSATKYAVLAISDALRQEEVVAKSNIRVTVISPGAIDTELPRTITDSDIKGNVDNFYQHMAISADRVAKTIEFAIDMPQDSTISEIILRPSCQQL